MSGAVDAVALLWALAALLFLLALTGTARRRRHGAMAGTLMLTAAALYSADIINLPEILGMLVIGAAGGILIGRETPRQNLPQFMIALAGSIGLACTAMMSAIRLNPHAFGFVEGAAETIAPGRAVAMAIGLALGAMACASGVAGLSSRQGSRPGRKLDMSIGCLLAPLAAGALLAFARSAGIIWLGAGMAIAALAAMLLARSMLSGGRTALLTAACAMAGWSAAALAFLLENMGLAVAGGIAGAAGGILAVRLYLHGGGKGLADPQRHP